MSNRKLTSPHCPHCGKPIAAPRKPAAGLTAEQFFDARNAACANAGADWHLADSAWFTIPNKLRSFKTARGTTIKCHRDGRLPAARYWPDGQLPAGLEPAAVSTRSPAELHRGYAARCAEWRDTAREMALIAFRARKRGEFARWKHDARQHETARLAALSYAAELERATPVAPEPIAEPAPAPVAAPEPAAPAYRLDIESAGRGWLTETYQTEDKARRAFRVWADNRHTVCAKLTEISSKRELERYDWHTKAAPVTPRPPREPAKPAATDPALAAVWQTAVASWRAYQSPADDAALAQCQDAVAVLLAALRDRGAHADHMMRAFKAGRAFPAHWFRSNEATA